MTTTWWAAALASRPLRTSAPPGARTLGMLAATAALAAPKQEPQWTRERVWLKVREVIVEQMGTDQFTEDSDFVNEIGIS